MQNILIFYAKYSHFLCKIVSFFMQNCLIFYAKLSHFLCKIVSFFMQNCLIFYAKLSHFLRKHLYKDSSLFNIGYHAFIACMLMVMTANEYFLYRLLNRLMKVHLNFYYKKQMKSLRMLAFANVIFYFTYGTLNLVIAIIEPDINEIVGLVPSDNHSSSLIRIMYLLWLIINLKEDFI